MWLLFVVVWLGLLAVTAVFAEQAFGYDFTWISTHFAALPVGIGSPLASVNWFIELTPHL